MKNLNLYRRALAGVILASALFVLGACQRPQNEMVAAFQKTTDAMLLAKVSQITKMRATISGGGSRGLYGTTSSNGLGSGYSRNLRQDASVCLNLAQQLPKQKKYYWAMVGVLIQCNERMVMASSNGLWGTMYPYLGNQGQAYMRYLSDFRNVSGQFVSGYGLGYQWGHSNMPMGLGNDQLYMWSMLGGQGNGFYHSGSQYQR